MNEQSKDFATMLRKAIQTTAGASVVKKPVIRKKQKPVRDAIYGAIEPKKKPNVQNKVLSDQEKQQIWNKNMKRAKKLPMLSKTATALASMQRSASRQPLPPVPASAVWKSNDARDSEQRTASAINTYVEDQVGAATATKIK